MPSRARAAVPALLFGLGLLAPLTMPPGEPPGVRLRVGPAASGPAASARSDAPARSDAGVEAIDLTGSATSAPPIGPDRSGRSRGAAVVRPVAVHPVEPLPPRLSWAPPVLRSPVTIPVGNSSATIKLDPARDYVLRLPAGRPAVRPAGLVISGGRNVVLIGGAVDVAGGTRISNGQIRRRALYLKGQTGTVFIEGVSFGSSTTGTLTEGIDLDERLGATVVLQNVRLARLVGSRSTNHADGLQTWAGPRRLLIDGLFLQTQYQGMFLLPNQQFKKGPKPQLWDFRNVSIVGEPGSGYLLWRDHQVFPWRLTSVFVQPGGRKLTSRKYFLWDPLGTFAGVHAVRAVPPVATGAGTGYRTPGYAGR